MLFDTLTSPGCWARAHPQQGHRQHKPEEQRHSKAVLPPRGTGTGWRTGLRKCLWSSTRVNAKSCIWGEIAQDSQAMLEGWKTALCRRIWEPWGTGAEQEPAPPPPWQSKPRAAWDPQEQHCQQVTANSAAQRDWGVSICADIQSLTGNGPEKAVPADLPGAVGKTAAPLQNMVLAWWQCLAAAIAYHGTFSPKSLLFFCKLSYLKIISLLYRLLFPCSPAVIFWAILSSSYRAKAWTLVACRSSCSATFLLQFSISCLRAAECSISASSRFLSDLQGAAASL